MDLRVTRSQRIHADGRHNAFTGITRAGDRYLVVFRSATDHVSRDGMITVIESTDLEHWQTTAVLSADGTDLRDPKIATLGDSVYLFCGGRSQDGAFASLVSVSADGRSFPEATPVDGVPAGRWLWGIGTHKDLLYGTAYSASAGGEFPTLHQSTDGIAWTTLADFPVPGNEVSIDFGNDGRLWALVRDDSGGSIPSLCTAGPPYASFTSARRLPIRLQGPMLARLEGACVIAGRRWDGPGRRNLRTDLFVVEDGHDIRFIRSLPSGGDTSYAGWLALGPDRALISYYSSHEHKMDVPCPGDDPAPRDPAHAEHTTAADIFLADVSLRPG